MTVHCLLLFIVSLFTVLSIILVYLHWIIMVFTNLYFSVNIENKTLVCSFRDSQFLNLLNFSAQFVRILTFYLMIFLYFVFVIRRHIFSIL